MADPRPWRNLSRSPVDIQGDIHPIPYDALDRIPKFDSRNHTSPEIHLSMFIQALNSLAVEYEDVAIHLFTMSLCGPVLEWFFNLPAKSITSWNDLEQHFLAAYSRRRDPAIVIKEFSYITRIDHETLQDFNCRFLKLYNEFPETLKPPELLAILLYENALHPQMSYSLKRENHTVLSRCIESARVIERQMISARLIEAPHQKTNAPINSSEVVSLQKIIHSEDINRSYIDQSDLESDHQDTYLLAFNQMAEFKAELNINHVSQILTCHENSNEQIDSDEDFESDIESVKEQRFDNPIFDMENEYALYDNEIFEILNDNHSDVSDEVPIDEPLIINDTSTQINDSSPDHSEINLFAKEPDSSRNELNYLSTIRDDIVEESNLQPISSQTNINQSSPCENHIAKQNGDLDIGLIPDIQHQCFIFNDEIFYTITCLQNRDESYIQSSFEACVSHMDDRFDLIPQSSKDEDLYILIIFESDAKSQVNIPISKFYDNIYPIFVDRKYLIHFYPP